MFDDIEVKIKKSNKILFSRESQCLQPLISLVRNQSHRTLVMWALDCGQATLETFEADFPDETRPRRCLDLCDQWASGVIKMPLAKRAILDAHAVAREIDDPVNIARCHAIGHAGATVHVETHALGLVFYELTALVIALGRVDYQGPVQDKIDFYYQKLLYWEANTDKNQRQWAKFLLDDSKPNKEKALYDKNNKHE